MRRYIPGACLLVAAAPKPPDKVASSVCLYQGGNERRYTVVAFLPVYRLSHPLAPYRSPQTSRRFVVLEPV